ncbi:MAG: rRNA maturation RNase YbeY [Lentisphaeria bacterium]
MLRAIKRAISLSNLDQKSNPNETLAVVLVDSATITALNETFLDHQSATDVITFDYRDDTTTDDGVIGEICVCVDVALSCPRAKSLGDEVCLYIVHGILHLCDENDVAVADRRRMHRRQNRIMKQLRKDFPLADIFK